MNSSKTRLWLGVAALACLLVGALITWRGGEGHGAVLLRAGAVLGALWVAWPAIVKVDPRWLAPAVIGLAIAIIRPALLVWLLPILIALGLFRRRALPPSRRRQ